MAPKRKADELVAVHSDLDSEVGPSNNSGGSSTVNPTLVDGSVDSHGIEINPADFDNDPDDEPDLDAYASLDASFLTSDTGLPSEDELQSHPENFQGMLIPILTP
jgi:hypothetical protein